MFTPAPRAERRAKPHVAEGQEARERLGAPTGRTGPASGRHRAGARNPRRQRCAMPTCVHHPLPVSNGATAHRSALPGAAPFHERRGVLVHPIMRVSLGGARHRGAERSERVRRNPFSPRRGSPYFSTSEPPWNSCRGRIAEEGHAFRPPPAGGAGVNGPTGRTARRSLPSRPSGRSESPGRPLRLLRQRVAATRAVTCAVSMRNPG